MINDPLIHFRGGLACGGDHRAVIRRRRGRAWGYGEAGPLLGHVGRVLGGWAHLPELERQQGSRVGAGAHSRDHRISRRGAHGYRLARLGGGDLTDGCALASSHELGKPGRQVERRGRWRRRQKVRVVLHLDVVRRFSEGCPTRRGRGAPERLLDERVCDVKAVALHAVDRVCAVPHGAPFRRVDPERADRADAPATFAGPLRGVCTDSLDVVVHGVAYCAVAQLQLERVAGPDGLAVVHCVLATTILHVPSIGVQKTGRRLGVLRYFERVAESVRVVGERRVRGGVRSSIGREQRQQRQHRQHAVMQGVGTGKAGVAEIQVREYAP